MSPRAESMEVRSARRRREASARLVRRPEDVEEFNREFWRRQGHEAVFEAAWDMLLDAQRIRGKRARQPRLQRSVAVLERRGR